MSFVRGTTAMQCMAQLQCPSALPVALHGNGRGTKLRRPLQHHLMMDRAKTLHHGVFKGLKPSESFFARVPKEHHVVAVTQQHKPLWHALEAF